MLVNSDVHSLGKSFLLCYWVWFWVVLAFCFVFFIFIFTTPKSHRRYRVTSPHVTVPASGLESCAVLRRRSSSTKRGAQDRPPAARPPARCPAVAASGCGRGAHYLTGVAQLLPSVLDRSFQHGLWATPNRDRCFPGRSALPGEGARVLEAAIRSSKVPGTAAGSQAFPGDPQTVTEPTELRRS